MAKDYFQDITPPSSQPPRRPIPPLTPSKVEGTPPAPAQPPVTAPTPPSSTPPETTMGEKSIRNIPITALKARPRIGSEDIRETPVMYPPPPPLPPKKKGGSKLWLWLAAGLAIIVLIAIGLVAFRSTTVTVVPRSHTVTFDDTARFTAYPTATAAAGTLPYTLETADFDDSEVVASTGTQHAEEKASGTVTVYNEYSSDSVKLIKNTRFETAGLIFRTPADIVVPGKKGATPGQVSVTVFADAVGEKYNVAATKFTVPGLKANAAMYAGVYAKSSVAMSGGFSGERPGVSDTALATAKSAIHSRLEAKARDAAESRKSDSTLAFSDLVKIAYETLAPTTESGSSVRLHEKAHVEIPLFPVDKFAEVVAQSVSTEAASGAVTIKSGSGFAAKPSLEAANLQTGPLQFTLAGSAQLVWTVDSEALAKALAGRDQGAFQNIVKDFPGVQEAHARIEPFWKSSFPTDASSIRIKVESAK